MLKLHQATESSEPGRGQRGLLPVDTAAGAARPLAGPAGGGARHGCDAVQPHAARTGAHLAALAAGADLVLRGVARGRRAGPVLAGLGQRDGVAEPAAAAARATPARLRRSRSSFRPAPE